MFLNKMMSREACVERYGPIDIASNAWPDAPKWMAMFEVPVGVFQDFTIMQTKIPVRHIACNRDILLPLRQAFDLIVNRGLASQLRTYDGCQILRCVRGDPGLFSAHCYALATDFNAATNPLGLPGDMSDELGACFVESGFDCGRNFSRRDDQHFSFCFEGR